MGARGGGGGGGGEKSEGYTQANPEDRECRGPPPEPQKC